MAIKKQKNSDLDLNVNYRNVFDACGFGIIILDEFSRLLYWNSWVSKHSNCTLTSNLGEHIEIIFPILEQTRLLNSIDDALHYRLPSTMSHKLNPQPLPLFKGKDSALEHNIKVVPLKHTDNTFHCMIEISDVSASVKRENRLRDILKKNLSS